MDATVDSPAAPPREAAAPPKQPRTEVLKRLRGHPLVIIGLVAAVIALGVLLYLLVSAGKEGTDDAQIEADVVPISARVAGQVLRVAIRENQPVKKGQPVLQIDDAEYVARQKQAVAEVETARAQADAADAQVAVVEAGAKGGLSSARAALSGSNVGVANAAAQIASARAALVRAQADARKAELDLGRANALKKAEAIPQQQLDNAQAAFDSAQAGLAQARAQLVASGEARRQATSRVGEAEGRVETSTPIEAQIEAAHAQTALAHARVDSAQAQLDLANLQLSYTRVLAPDEGVVSRLGVHEGQHVSVGQAIVELVPSEAYVVANFKETQIGKMHAGQSADVKIDTYGKTLHGTVESLSGGTGARFSLLPPDNATGNFVKVVQRVPVRIRLPKLPDGMVLRAGQSADVTVHVN